MAKGIVVLACLGEEIGGVIKMEIEEFTQRKGKEMENIRDTIEDINDAKITHTNFKVYSDKTKNKCEVMESHIQNFMDKFDDINKKLNLKLEDKKLKEYIEEEEFVPKDIFDISTMKCDAMEEAFSWMTVENELLFMMFMKLTNAISAVKSMDIEREVLSNFKEVQKENNEMIKTLLIDKQRMIEEKFDTIKDSVDSKFEMLAQTVVDPLIRVLNRVSNESVKELSYSKEPIKTPTMIKEEKIEEVKKGNDIIIEKMRKKDIEKKIEIPDENIGKGIIEEKKVYKCEECDKKFDNAEALKAHKTFFHEEDE